MPAGKPTFTTKERGPLRLLGMEQKAKKVFFLTARDPATHCIAREARFEIEGFAELCSLLGIPVQDWEARSTYDLDPADAVALARHYGITFDPGTMPSEVRPWNAADDLPYTVHTGRELAMMLAGTKPLAAFVDDDPSLHGAYVIPEREFEPHVASGRIIKREQLVPPSADAPVVHGQRIGGRRVLYGLPGQQWRIDAYLLLYETAEKSGWNEDLERMEGTLLGYEGWQNELNIERKFRSTKSEESATPAGAPATHANSPAKS